MPLKPVKDIAIPNVIGIAHVVVDCCSLMVTGNNTVIATTLTNIIQ